MLKTRLWMGALLIAGLAGGLWIDEHLGPHIPFGVPPYPCWLLVAIFVVVGCCRELRQLMRRRGIRTHRWLTYGTVVAITASNWIPFLRVPAPEQMEHLVWALSAVCLANMLFLIREAVIFRDPGSAVITAAGGMLTTFYLGSLAAFLIELRWASYGLLALAAHIAAAKCGDTGAYFGGRAFGRHKLCPSLSPNKTIEGAIAGLISSVLGTLAVVAIGAKISNAPAVMSWSSAGLFGVTVGAAAMVGDLIESLIKRDCQQKDASDLVPGFGGMLDVMDSPLFSAPVAFGLWVWIGPSGAPISS
jgi:phosphatidate cytidylyltransferase